MSEPPNPLFILQDARWSSEQIAGITPISASSNPYHRNAKAMTAAIIKTQVPQTTAEILCRFFFITEH